MPLRPFRPNRLLVYLGGLIGGLVIGLGLTGLLEYLESGFRSEDDIARVLSVPVLAAIPAMKSDVDDGFAMASWWKRQH